MPAKSDEVFVIEGEDLRSLPARLLRAGLFGKTLEEALQTLIEKHPGVLPGKQMDPGSDDPPRFILLRREMPVAGGSLDHLLVDQRGVLTLVEAKLIENAESHRQVIGQIVQYAANAADAWGDGRVREKAAEFWSDRGRDVGELLREAFGGEIDVETFWNEVEENLQQGKLRLIIAADELRPEVRRMIEYLNAEMRRAEVYGLELRCYGDEAGSLVLVPHLVGQTQVSADRKVSGKAVRWPADRLRAAYDDLPNRELAGRLREVLDWATGRGFFLEARAETPIFGLRGRSGNRIVSFFSDGSVYCFLHANQYPGGEEERDRFVAELKDLRMLDLELDPRGVVAGRNLARKLTDMEEEEFRKLLEVLSCYCENPKGG